MKEIKETFDLFDFDGNGRIEIKELTMASRALGYTISKEDLENIV